MKGWKEAASQKTEQKQTWQQIARYSVTAGKK